LLDLLEDRRPLLELDFDVDFDFDLDLDLDLVPWLAISPPSGFGL
jgi:hypothetical protein